MGVFLCVGSNRTPAHADTNSPTSAIAQALLDPMDSSLWVRWHDIRPPSGDHLSHVTVAGTVSQTLTLPGDGSLARLVLLPQGPRYYYLAPNPTDRPNLEAYADDVFTGHIAAVHDLYDSIANAHAQFFYNPLLQHLYVAADGQTLVYDATGTTRLHTLPFRVLAENPVTHRYYVKQTTTISYTTALAVHTMDARTEQVTADPALLERTTGNTTVTSIQVNGRTGTVYLTVQYCLGACQPPQVLGYSGSGSPVPAIPVPFGVLTGVNESTNQLYGTLWTCPTASRSTCLDQTETRATDTVGHTQARFPWQPVAIDQSHNRVYGPNVSGDSPDTATASGGFGLWVMDGTHDDIITTVPLHSPDPALGTAADPFTGTLPPNARLFPQTRHSLSGLFLAYWLAHGGLPIFGYPITEPIPTAASGSSRGAYVQYFERARFEYHPDYAGTPNAVELGLLGRQFGAWSGPEMTGGPYYSGQTQPIAGGLRYLETGHTLTGPFLTYWQGHGGLALFGLPFTEPFSEVNPIDGQTYTVQYFERARFEYHPAFAGTANAVELGLLGTQYVRANGWPVS